MYTNLLPTPDEMQEAQNVLQKPLDILQENILCDDNKQKTQDIFQDSIMYYTMHDDDKQLTPYKIITPRLAIGSADCLKDKSFRKGFNVIVSVTPNKNEGIHTVQGFPNQWTPYHSKPDGFSGSMTAKWGKQMIWDIGYGLTDPEKFYHFFQRVLELIPALFHQHIKKNHKILIYCHDGLSDSVAVAIALLMSLSTVSSRPYEEGYIMNYIKTKHPRLVLNHYHISALMDNKKALYCTLLCS